MITYLAKLGELTLKGGNLHQFEKLLEQNARFCLKKYIKNNNFQLELHAGRMYICCKEEDCEAAEFTLSHLLGITGWAKASVCEKNINAIKETVLKEAKCAVLKGARSFKIEARRADKTFPLDSYQIACEGAALVFDSGLMQVDVKKPDVKIYVEVREKCFVYAYSKKGCRGLPAGCSGKGLLLLSGGLDSPVAAWRMMRRGMKIECMYFHSYPYTSEEAQQKVESLAKKLSCYGVYTYLNIIPFTDVQKKIKEKVPASWTTLMLRVCMIKAANILAHRIHADCIVTGESLGQVASQTIENMKVTEYFSKYPLLRPLAGMDKEEIVETANFIGTFEISILPYEDCCVLFSPKHPVLRGTTEEAQAIYDSLEADDLIQTAYEKRIVKKFSFGDKISSV